jgi:hypothetical protein
MATAPHIPEIRRNSAAYQPGRVKTGSPALPDAERCGRLLGRGEKTAVPANGVQQSEGRRGAKPEGRGAERRYLDTEREHLDKKKRIAARNGLIVRLYHSLLDIGREDEAANLIGCGHYFWIFKSKCGVERLQPCRCDHPLCPDCARERSFPLQRRVFDLTKNKPNKAYKFITLTRKNVYSISNQYVRSLAKDFAKLRRMPFWSDWISGGVWSCETTYNVFEESWHVHLHAIVEVSWPGSAAAGLRGRPWLPDEWIFEVQRNWLEITGDSHVVNMRSVTHRAIKELVKYQAKVADFVFSPPLVSEYLEAFAKVRRIQCFGTFLGQAEEQTAKQVQDDERQLWLCFCGKCSFKNGRWRCFGKAHQSVCCEGEDGEMHVRNRSGGDLEFSLTEKEYLDTSQKRIAFDPSLWIEKNIGQREIAF